MKYRIEITEYPAYAYEIIGPDESGQDIRWESDDGYYSAEEAREAAEALIAQDPDAEVEG